MSNINDFFPSNYLRAADLKGKEIDAIIDRVTSEEFEQDGKKRTKPVIHFRNAASLSRALAFFGSSTTARS